MHIENMKRKDFITVLDVVGNGDLLPMDSYTGALMLTDSETARRLEALRYSDLRGEVMQIETINPPFLGVTVYLAHKPPGRTMIDTRLVDLKPISDDYADFFMQGCLQHLVTIANKHGYVVGKLAQISKEDRDAMIEKGHTVITLSTDAETRESGEPNSHMELEISLGE